MHESEKEGDDKKLGEISLTSFSFSQIQSIVVLLISNFTAIMSSMYMLYTFS